MDFQYYIHIQITYNLEVNNELPNVQVKTLNYRNY